MGVTFAFRYGYPDKLVPWLEQNIGSRHEQWSGKRVDFRRSSGAIWYTPTVTIFDDQKAVLFALRWGDEILE